MNLKKGSRGMGVKDVDDDSHKKKGDVMRCGKQLWWLESEFVNFRR